MCLPVYQPHLSLGPSSESEHVVATKSSPGQSPGVESSPCRANKANKANIKSPLIISGRKVKRDGLSSQLKREH